MNMNHSLRTNPGATVRQSVLLLAAFFLPCLLTRADIYGPYTPDANTLYLFHFDDPPGSTNTLNTGSKGGQCLTVTNTTTGTGLATPPVVSTMLGQVAYTNATVHIGFGNCVSATNAVDPTANAVLDGLIAYDGNGNGVYNGDNGSLAGDAITMTNLNIGNTNDVPAGNSPFTIEALVNCASNIVGNVNQEIVCSDDSPNPRGFQFRINNQGQLEFNYIGGTPASGSKTAVIPTTGPNAFALNTWFHVAVTYDGTNLFLYWTKLDPSSQACKLIGGPFPWKSTISNGLAVCPLIIGNEDRSASSENFKGLIDEVRISSVCRSAGQMMFTNSGVIIVQDPASQSIDYFQPVTFTVTASSPAPVGYLWRFNGTPISAAATNQSITIPSVDLTAAGSYDVVVTNTSGFGATSAPAILIVGADHFLAHRWSFNSDTLTNDSVGGATGTNKGTANVSGGTLNLDGSAGCYMELPHDLIHNSNYTAVTFEFWATYNASGNNDRVFDFGNTNFVNPTVLPPENYVYFSPHAGVNHVLGFSPTTTESQISATGSNNLDGQINMYVACVVDPPDNIMSIYTNGVFETSAAISASLSSIIDDKCWIGRSLFVADSYINASIDEFRIYSGALSPASIAQSFSQGPDTPLNAGPVAITVQPTNTTGAVGFPVSIIAAVVGRAPINLQWYEGGTPIPGATNPVYTFTPILSQNGHVFQFLATNTVTGTNYTVASSNAVLTVTVPETLVWAGINSGNWDTSTLNWSNAIGTQLKAFAQYDGVVFDDRGAVQPTVNLSQAINLTSLLVSNNAFDYVLQSTNVAQALNGQAVSLIKAGTGKLTLDAYNNCSGFTLIQNGTLQVGNADSTGTLIAGPVTNNASLVFNRASSITATNNISGSGTVTQSGTGDLTLSASNTFTGGLTVNNGRVLMQDLNALGPGSVVVNAGSEIYLLGSSGVISPSAMTLNGAGPASGGALRKGNQTTSTFGGTVTLGSATTLNVDGNGAVLNLTNAAGINGADVNAALTLAGSGAGNITGPLSLGTGSLDVTGGTWTVAPSNNFSGLTTIEAGALLITGPLSLGPVPGIFNAGAVTLNGGALGSATNVTLNDGKIGITVSDASNASGIVVNNTNAIFNIANNISGDASTALTKTGSGTLILSGSNAYQGTLNIDSSSASANDGTTVIANNLAIANVLAFPGAPYIFIRNNNNGSSTLALDGTLGSITVAPDISLAGRNTNVPAILNLAGNNTISGGFTLNVGGSYPIESDSGTLTLSTGLPEAVATNVNTPRGLTFTGAGTITMSAAIQDVFNSFLGTNVAMNVVKNGSGTLNLPVANTYSGTTIVSNGVLSLPSPGSIGTNNVTVSGGLLVGNGTIAGPVTAQSGGAIEAGTTTTIGTLNLSSPLTLSGNTVVKISKTGGTHDLFSGQSSVTYGGTLTVTNLAGTLTTSDSFTLFSPGASASNFASIIGSPGPGLAYSFTNGVLSVVVGVANNPTNITISVSGSTLTLSWPADHTGWILQSQTNALGVGLSSNWADVAGSESSNTNVSTITHTNPAVFYRLRH